MKSAINIIVCVLGQGRKCAVTNTCNLCRPSYRYDCGTVFICPIAIAYSMEQIIKSVCVCQSVSLSVCVHSHGRRRTDRQTFTNIGTDVKKTKGRTSSLWGQYRTTPSPILPPQEKNHFRTRGAENSRKY